MGITRKISIPLSKLANKYDIAHFCWLTALLETKLKRAFSLIEPYWTIIEKRGILQIMKGIF